MGLNAGADVLAVGLSVYDPKNGLYIGATAY
jgi:hypothetical protein